jgi:hypothetical protein
MYKRKTKINFLKSPAELDRAQQKMLRRHGATIQANPVPVYVPQDDVSIERHFTVAEVSEAWNLTPATVRAMFRDVPGVLKLGTKNKHVVLRIPGRLLKSYHAKLSAERRVQRIDRTKTKPIAKINITRRSR